MSGSEVVFFCGRKMGQIGLAIGGRLLESWVGTVAVDGDWVRWLALGDVVGAEISEGGEYCRYCANEVLAGRAEWSTNPDGMGALPWRDRQIFGKSGSRLHTGSVRFTADT